MQLIVGPLADVHGRRPVLLLGLTGTPPLATLTSLHANGPARSSASLYAGGRPLLAVCFDPHAPSRAHRPSDGDGLGNDHKSSAQAAVASHCGGTRDRIHAGTDPMDARAEVARAADAVMGVCV